MRSVSGPGPRPPQQFRRRPGRTSPHGAAGARAAVRSEVTETGQLQAIIQVCANTSHGAGKRHEVACHVVFTSQDSSCPRTKSQAGGAEGAGPIGLALPERQQHLKERQAFLF